MFKRKIAIFLVFSIVLTNNIIGENVSKYSPEFIGKITIGRNNGELGFEIPIAGSNSSPYIFIINRKNEILIPDIINNRLNIYDLFLKSIRTLRDINDCRYARKIEVDNNDNIYCLMGGETGLIKTNAEGKLIFQIDKYSLPKNVYKMKNFFIINNELFFYDDSNNIKIIDEKGEIKDPSVAKQKINELANQMNSYSKELEKIGLPKKDIDFFNMVKEESGLLFVGNNFYNTDFNKTKEYFDKIEPIRKKIDLLEKRNQSENKKNIELKYSSFSRLTLFGYDKDHNSYWESSKTSNIGSNQIIIIFSKFGALIDAFYYGQYKRQGMSGVADRSVYKTSGALITVSWDGDLYFMCSPLIEIKSNNFGTFDAEIVGEMAGVYAFYKVERQW